MNTMDCKTCRSIFPDLLLEGDFVPPLAVSEHLLACADCRTELDDLRNTMLVLSEWTAPEPSPYFDGRIYAHLRDAQRSAPESLWERLVATLHFSTGRGFRSALAGAFLFLLLLGGGTVATFWPSHGTAPAASSPTVNDLRIYDTNAQAFQQLDLLDDTGSNATEQPQS